MKPENNFSNKKRVYVVHCVDTEGPLYESLDATFDRLYSLLGVKLEPSKNILEKIQNKQFDLNGKFVVLDGVFDRN